MFNSKNLNPDHDGRAFVLTAFVASDDITRIFDKQSKGHIHSVFNTSFNLAFGDHLVHVGAVGNGVAPFGIGMEQGQATLLTKLLAVNSDVYWDERSVSLIFPKGIILSLDRVNWTNHKVQQAHYELMRLEENFTILANTLMQADWQIGLAQSEEEKKRFIQYVLNPSSSTTKDFPVIDELERLQNLAFNEESTDAEKVFDYWIGRGLGLTPSGDDCITGICAVFSALEGTNQAFIHQLQSYLVERGRKRTTHIALEYLLYATENKFHSHLLNVCNALGKRPVTEFSKAIEEMKGIGHTSGADTLVGILIGIKAVVMHKKKGDYY
ncbi:DUF2877 domain-containing protein [Sporosarcina sp. ACRSL]|uniref:DUF2877 domain-containing protein n=1 Tax=Sporosarcina sp. ACRSL TaxID=2918215 RepID=UPI001EF418D6|nr:DUF2877 domain-containing protein [Sporosarcina sp. ACRSL]MCG7345681.1 DUF2877 domain-containing protein [Sporosarcina sp. ACRSL]